MWRDKINIKKYEPKDSLVKTIDFVWHLTSDKPIENALLLPVENTDLIINTSSPIYYSNIPNAGYNVNAAPTAHIRNFKLSPQYISQDTPIDVWGVSLMPYTPYLILNEDMEKHKESIIDLDKIAPNLSRTLKNHSDDFSTIINNSLSINMHKYEIEIIIDFLSNTLKYQIGDYCHMKKLSIKYLERVMKKYTGYTPKQFQQIIRFQHASNDFIYSRSVANISDVAYSNDYTDQMHLTKVFKRYTGKTPSSFLKEKNMVKKRIWDYNG